MVPMPDGDRLSETSWVCEFCAHTFCVRRPEGDDPERCENCGHPQLRGFAPDDPAAEDFTEEVRRRNQAIGEVPALLARGRANRPDRDEKVTLVVCEHDEVTLDLLCEHLVADGFAVLRAQTAAEALRLCAGNPDLLLLDQALPDTSGLSVLREIRDSGASHHRVDPQLPVIVLGASGGRRDHLRLLDSGADDHLVKPFAYPELRARIGAVLRRRSHPSEGALGIGELVINLSRREVTVKGRAIALARREFDLLRVLAAEPARVYSKEELMFAVWGHRSATRRRALDSHAARLRRKLDPEHHRFVINCWGIGYRLIDG